MTYTLKITHYNTSANVFFETASENAHLLPALAQVGQSIHMKNNVVWNGQETVYQQDVNGTYMRVYTQPNFTSVESAETRFNDFSNSTFWQENVFEWNKNNGIKGRFEILDENGNLVKLLHDNRGISVQGSGPSAWVPYVPLENV
jgi:hypothetical protein